MLKENSPMIMKSRTIATILNENFIKPQQTNNNASDNILKAIEKKNKKTKEMLGLVASMVLRCDDCIKYHVGKCHETGTTTEELYEVFAIANIVGGTIVIPHTRRAAEYWEELMEG